MTLRLNLIVINSFQGLASGTKLIQKTNVIPSHVLRQLSFVLKWCIITKVTVPICITRITSNIELGQFVALTPEYRLIFYAD